MTLPSFQSHILTVAKTASITFSLACFAACSSAGNGPASLSSASTVDIKSSDIFHMIQDGARNPTGMLAIRSMSFSDFNRAVATASGGDLDASFTLGGIQISGLQTRAASISSNNEASGSVKIGTYLNSIGFNPASITEEQIAASVRLIPDLLNRTGIFSDLPRAAGAALSLDDDTSSEGSVAAETPSNDPATPAAAAAEDNGGKWSATACNAMTALNGISNISWGLTGGSGLATAILNHLSHSMTSRVAIATGAIGVLAGTTGTTGWAMGINAKCGG